MRSLSQTYSLLLSLFLLLLSTPPQTSASTSPPYTTTIHHFRPSSPNPIPLATLSYHPQHPHLSKLLTYTPPPNSTDLTAIAIILDSEAVPPRYRSSLASVASFHAPYQGRFRLVLSLAGDVRGVGWRAGVGAGAGAVSAANEGGDGSVAKGAGRYNARGDFDLLLEKEGAKPVLERVVGRGRAVGAGTGAGGEEEEVVEEKTLLQKYWWVLVGVAFLALTGGGGDR